MIKRKKHNLIWIVRKFSPLDMFVPAMLTYCLFLHFYLVFSISLLNLLIFNLNMFNQVYICGETKSRTSLM